MESKDCPVKDINCEYFSEVSKKCLYTGTIKGKRECVHEKVNKGIQWYRT